MPAFPSRIISLAPSNTEILYALGVGDKVVACTRFCDYPPEARAKPKVGGWLDISNGAVQKLQPDLILTSSFVQLGVVNRLKTLNLPVTHFDPVNLEQVFQSVLAIGQLVGRPSEARDLVQILKTRMGRVRERIPASARPRVYVEEWHRPLTASGNWVPDLIELAGGQPMVRSGKPSLTVTPDEVLAFNPEVIVISWCGFGDKADVEAIYRRENWGAIEAVKNQRVHVMNDSLLNRPGPRLTEGMEQLARMIHPGVG